MRSLLLVLLVSTVMSLPSSPSVPGHTGSSPDPASRQLDRLQWMEEVRRVEPRGSKLGRASHTALGSVNC